jgi:vesicle coat complex subunit
MLSVCSLQQLLTYLAFITGELAELAQQLQSPKKNDKRDAVKKVIANMTVGKDVR